MERLDGIEPTTPLWKSGVLPLNYSRKALGQPFTTGSAGSSQLRFQQSNHFSGGRLKGSVLEWCYAGYSHANVPTDNALVCDDHPFRRRMAVLGLGAK